MATDETEQLKEAGKRLLALFQDQEIDHPAAFGEFRKAFGYTEEPIPIRPTVITLPVEDQAYQTVLAFEANKTILGKAFDDNRDLRDVILQTMGSADCLKFSDGTTVMRKVVERPAGQVKAVKYNTIHVKLRGQGAS